MSWTYTDFKNWIDSGCPQDVTDTVRALYLDSNNFSTLPECVGQLVNLKTLDLSYNNFSTLPECVGQLVNLKRLDLKSNNFSTLPECVGQLVNLKWLDLGDNNFSTLPECVGQLVNLEYLGLSSNKLPTLPDCVGQLVNLKWLHLGSNNFSTLPECVGQLVNLTYLYLGSNNFSTLPECVGQLVNLEWLILSSNNFSTLPECVGQLVNLKTLYLGSSNFSTLPECVGQLVNLETLYLNNNNFSTLPPLLGNLQRLRNFYYDNNPIDYIPANVLRMINRNQNVQGVYTDAQSVHNSTIQKSLLDSVNRLLSIPIRDKDVLVQIIEDPILTDESKARLVEYSEDTSVHTVLNLTFSEMLSVVWNRLDTLESRDDIKKTLNTEILDAECKCFTGKISRLVNCLTGYDELVVVEIADKEQIGTVIEIVRTRLGDNYTVEEHRRISIQELAERGYNREVIDEWVEQIE